MDNDDLSSIDATLAREQPLPYALAKKLRDQLADNAVRGVARDKRVADLEREVARFKADDTARKAAYERVSRACSSSGSEMDHEGRGR